MHNVRGVLLDGDEVAREAPRQTSLPQDVLRVESGTENEVLSVVLGGLSGCGI